MNPELLQSLKTERERLLTVAKSISSVILHYESQEDISPKEQPIAVTLKPTRTETPIEPVNVIKKHFSTFDIQNTIKFINKLFNVTIERRSKDIKSTAARHIFIKYMHTYSKCKMSDITGALGMHELSGFNALAMYHNRIETDGIYIAMAKQFAENAKEIRIAS